MWIYHVVLYHEDGGEDLDSRYFAQESVANLQCRLLNSRDFPNEKEEYLKYCWHVEHIEVIE
jgi:hypothetical protein